MRKLSSAATGRLKPLRLFSTLLIIRSMSAIACYIRTRCRLWTPRLSRNLNHSDAFSP